MKILALILSLFVTSSYAQTNSYKDSTSWALHYGRSTMVDGRKNAEDLTPTGNSFKGTWAARSKYFEAGFLVRFANLSDDFKFEGTKGKLNTRDLTLGVNGGFWMFSWLKLHAGYALHNMIETIEGDFSSTQKTELSTKYRLINTPSYGLYGGVDLVLLQTKTFQLFTNYDYYYMNNSNAHQWEAMAGVRLYIGGASKVGKGNFFVKMFTALFAPKEK